MIHYLGWLGNALIVAGLWTLGYKWRPAFLLTAAGELLWIFASLYKHQWDLAAICIVFLFLAIRNWYVWGDNA